MEFSIYLNFNGNCEEAMTFYKDALGAEIVNMQRFSDMPPNPAMPVAEEDKNRVLHSRIEKDGFVIMGSDSNAQNPISFGDNASISISFPDEAGIDKTFTAISSGGKVTMPLQDTFWGAKFGMCVDKFGTCWMFNYDRPQA